MTSHPSAEDATCDATAPLCEKCGQPFTRRTASGGRPQRFCSPSVARLSIPTAANVTNVAQRAAR